MLEWYQPHYDHHQLMDEMDELLQLILKTQTADRKTYADLFQTYLSIDPHTASMQTLSECAKANAILLGSEVNDKDTWLNLLMTHCIEPHLGENRPCFIYDFPASQAALARIQSGPLAVAARFEVYFKGMELANGFYELQDVNEQRKRFENNLAERKKLGLPLLPIDEFFFSSPNPGITRLFRCCIRD